MRLAMAVATMLALSAVAGWAQHQQVEINAETPEGKLLQSAGMESDPAKKLALLEDVITKSPDSPMVVLAYVQAHPLYMAAQQWDKAMDVGEKLLAKDPSYVSIAHESLKAAEAKKDPDLIIKWAALTSQVARKAAAAPKPAEADAEDAWTKDVDYAKQVDTYSEYALYAAALQTTDPAKKVALGEALEKQNPNSQYLPQVRAQVFLAYQQKGDNAKAFALAEKAVQSDQTNEDMLLLVANRYLEQKKEPEKVLAYSQKVIDLMASKPKPEGMADADWESRKKLETGLAYWIMGFTYANEGKYSLVDKAMRQALPLVESNAQLKAAALFQLGVANFKMGDTSGNKQEILDAVRFTEECAAMKSPYQAQAQKNLAGIKAKYHVTK